MCYRKNKFTFEHAMSKVVRSENYSLFITNKRKQEEKRRENRFLKPGISFPLA